MTSVFTAIDGCKIAYRDEGQGMPLICLAGLTRDRRDFDYVAPHLKGVRMICMDYRGRGLSEWSGAESYSIPQESQDVLSLMDHVGLEKAAILGTSRGGLIGMGLAATVPQRIIGLCLNDVGPVLDRAGLDRIDTYLGVPPKAKTHEAMARLLAMTPGFANIPHDRWLEEATHLFNATEDGLALRYDPALRDPFIEAMAGEIPDAWPLYDMIPDIPMALIRGVNSDLISAATADEMQARRPRLIRAEVPDRAHIPFLDEPEARAALLEFITQCRDASLD